MKLSLQLAQTTTDTDITSIGAPAIVAKIGAQLGAVEDVIDWGERFNDVIVAKIVQSEKHPNADKLNICLIDDGGKVANIARDGKGLIQVVCGAPNARAGLLVAWLPPGSVVPATINDQEPFLLGVRELRGLVSNGMLASPSELGISDDHDGILEIDQDVAPGAAFVTLYGLEDTIIDLENKMFTHRPDCFGIIGVARELAGIQQKQYTSPDWYAQEPSFAKRTAKNMKVDVQTDFVSRFSAIVVDSVSVTPSPTWMQSDLTKLGIRPINNIVDITNWLMYMTGQPLHAYDYDKVLSLSKDNLPTLRARQSISGEKLELLNGKTVTFADDTSVVICANDTPIGIGGVMGGADTEVDDTTKTIIIEAATFDMYNIRKTSMKYGLFTDAVTRFNKGQSPLQTTRILAKALNMVQEIAGGSQASTLCDYKATTVGQLPDVTTDVGFINSRLGTTLTAQYIATLLNNVECITRVDGTRITVTIPFWRRDLHVPEDIVEEVGRLHGFDTLPIELPQRSAAPAKRNDLVDFKYILRSILSACGANEVLSYSFVHKKVLDAASQDTDSAFRLSNALSPNLQYYRLSLIPSLLGNVHKNIKAGYGAFALYEIGKVHSKQWIDEDSVPIEAGRIALVFSADTKSQKHYQGEPYYQARVFLDELAQNIGVSLLYKQWSDVDPLYTASSMLQPFFVDRSAVIMLEDGKVVGIIGEFSSSEIAANKLPAFTAGFELDTNVLYTASKQSTKQYIPFPKYPKVTQDITLQAAQTIPFHTVYQSLQDALRQNAPPDCTIDLQPTDIYQTATALRFSFRIVAFSDNTTMVAHDVNALLDTVATALQDSLNVTRI